DSSALGMLLVLREYASPKGIEVYIKNASSDVGELLRIANFEQLFEIS
ncbi:MAG: STAS domain-containing protein, partial [Planctomycetota bacterium]